MSIFKCKMCGGTLEFNPGDVVGVCDSCGTKQTLPNGNDEIVANLHNRANTLRLRCDFDKAEETYNKILETNPKDAEAHWGIILCKYGIEYVEDPKTGKRVPTCHRTSFDAVLADDDYKAALTYAVGEQKTLYEAEAKEIDRIQKDILSIVKNEKPFDVFICYKETDTSGKRTQDSVIANDIYYQLTQEGFKVFYAAITLENKIGREYEPYIFAALNSAQVMLVVGSKPEYFNAVWVKNEWSRFLKLMKTDRKKLLIPCYRDMDAYELPEEFAHLQAQDMGKIGFINDIVRGIKKVISDSTPTKTEPREAAAVNAAGAGAAPLLKRAFMFLEDGEFEKADDFCEQVLNLDPECAEAYLYKLMAQLHVRNEEQLRDTDNDFENSPNCQKVLRFGDETLKDKMNGYLSAQHERKKEKWKKALYTQAKKKMENALTPTDFQSAASEFESISDYYDSNALKQQCIDRANELTAEEEEKRIAAEKAAKKRKKAFAIGTPIVCVCIAFLVLLNAIIIPEIKYDKAMKLIDSGEYEAAYLILNGLSYKDSVDIKLECIQILMGKADMGNIVFFGSYEQDNDTSNGKEDIEWKVLTKENNRVLLISDKALDCKPYNTSYDNVTWESCSLRKWLNGTFLNDAFSAEEQRLIQSTTMSADKNPEYSTNPGNATTDKVFLLSITEAKKYFDSDEARNCAPTAYAIAQGAWTSDSYKTTDGDAISWWWLRSPGFNQKSAAYVSTVGAVYFIGDYVYFDDYCVRPAIWVSLES